MNSQWLKELEAINSSHRLYRPESWRDRTHSVFWFHDSTFECVARSYKVEAHRISMKGLLGVMVERLLAWRAEPGRGKTGSVLQQLPGGSEGER